jgi:hypothetical protein
MDWKPYKGGHLAKCKHGYYFVYRKFDHELGSYRWFVKYERGADKFGEQGQLTGNINGYDSLEDAQAYSDQNAEDVERSTRL